MTGEDARPRGGPLAGVTVLELGGIGPLPLFAMLYADLGARIIRVDPAGPAYGTIGPHLWIYRGQESVTIDLRQPRGQELLLHLVDRADILVEGYRPGVAERLGVGPDVCLARNPRLVYGRMTGWGEGGPLSDRGGHDINYIGLTGALEAMGPPDAPPPVPLNLVGDFGGGAMMLAMGVLAALHEREQSGRGQVVEAAMSDGTLALMALFYAMRDAGHWVDARGANQPQGFAPFYRCYETSDGGYMAVGAVEGKFYVALLDGLGFDPTLAATQHDRAAVARTHAGVRGGVPLAHACRVGSGVRDARRVRHARPEHDRSARAPAQRRARLLRRRERSPAGRPARAVRSHAGDDRRSVAGGRCRQRPRARRAGPRRRRDREAARRRHDRMNRRTP